MSCCGRPNISLCAPFRPFVLIRVTHFRAKQGHGCSLEDMTEAERKWLENTAAAYKQRVLEALDALLERRISSVLLDDSSKAEVAVRTYRQGAADALEAFNVPALLDALEVVREEGELAALERSLSKGAAPN